MTKKPNLVIFVPDSFRGDVQGHLGNPGAVTPNLDAMVAEDAVSYANAFSQSPVCTPSRCSFMTGWYPHTHGHRSMKNMLKDHEPHLLKVLREEGYFAWWGGKNDLVAVKTPEDYLKHCDVKYRPEPRDSGYRVKPPDPNDPRRGVFFQGVAEKDGEGVPHNPSDPLQVEGAVDFIHGAPSDKPYCVYLPLSFPHPAYAVSREYYDRIDPESLPPRHPVPTEGAPLPPVLEAMRKAYGADDVSERDWLDIKRIYYGMCCMIDDLFGKVVQALKDTGVYDETLIVFLSDHGDFAGDYSLPEKTHCSLQDALVHVPLVIKPPRGVAARPGVRRQMVELLDLPATVYDLLNIDPGYTCQGHSLRDSLAGNETGLRDAVFCEVGSRKEDVSFKNLDVKTMPPGSFYQRQSSAALPAHDNGSYAVMCRTRKHKYIRRGYSDYNELYDLEKDPGELRNLSGRPDYHEIEQSLQTRLLDFFMQTADVLPHVQDSRRI